MNQTKLTVVLFGFVLSSLPAIASGQMSGGMGGGGMGGGLMGGFGSAPLEVVIMLGSEYEYQESPFTSATEVVKAIREHGEENGIFIPGSPSLSSVRVDIETTIPESKQRTIVASHVKTLEGKKLEDFKARVKLTALRFGTTSVEFVPVDALDEVSSSIWLREPFRSATQLSKDARALLDITSALATDENGQAKRPRLDLFEAPQDEMGGMEMMEMGGMGMGGGMGMDDMMMDMDEGYGMEMDMGPPPSIEELEEVVAENRRIHKDLQRRIRSKQTEYHAAERSQLESVRQELSALIDQENELQGEHYGLQVELLDRKTERLRKALKLWRKDRDGRRNRRLRELLNKEPGSN